MSEEVVIVDEVVGDVMFVLRLDSCIAHFDKDNARKLRDSLNAFLGADKQPGSTETKFYGNVAEPDLPIGTLLRDNEGDVLEKVEDGYQWIEIGGDSIDYPSVYRWATLVDEDMHRWFEVIE